MLEKRAWEGEGDSPTRVAAQTQWRGLQGLPARVSPQARPLHSLYPIRLCVGWASRENKWAPLAGACSSHSLLEGRDGGLGWVRGTAASQRAPSAPPKGSGCTAPLPLLIKGATVNLTPDLKRKSRMLPCLQLLTSSRRAHTHFHKTQWKSVRHTVMYNSSWSMDCNLPGSSVHDIILARILEWVAMPFFRGSSRSRDRIRVSCTAGRFFIIWTTRAAHKTEGSRKCESEQIRILRALGASIKEWGGQVEKTVLSWFLPKPVLRVQHCWGKWQKTWAVVWPQLA